MDQFDGELEETVARTSDPENLLVSSVGTFASLKELTDNPQDRSVFGVFLGGRQAGGSHKTMWHLSSKA